jgi:hypothetical protein
MSQDQYALEGLEAVHRRSVLSAMALVEKEGFSSVGKSALPGTRRARLAIMVEAFSSVRSNTERSL